MNTYKKTITALGIILTIVPYTFASMPNVERKFETAYQDIFDSPYNLFKPAKDFTEWYINMGELIKIAQPYAGNDSVLTESIKQLLEVNTTFINAMRKCYALFAENPYPSALDKSRALILFSNNKLKLDQTMNTLRKETYLLPGKRKAKDILLFILDKLSRAHTTAENALKK